MAPTDGETESEAQTVPAGAPALTLEGGAEFEEGDEPNFNRVEPQPTAAAGDRGGDRGPRPGGRPGGGGGGGRHRRRRDGRGGHGGGRR
jgi:hypothetical protein